MLHQDKTCSVFACSFWKCWNKSIYYITLHHNYGVYYLNAYYVSKQECTLVAYSCGFVRLHIRRVALWAKHQHAGDPWFLSIEGRQPLLSKETFLSYFSTPQKIYMEMQSVATYDYLIL